MANHIASLKCIQRICVWLMLSLFGGLFTAQAQTYRFKEREASMVRTALEIKQHNGFPDTITVKQDKWDEIVATGSSWTSRLKFKSLQSYVRFYVNHASPYQVTQPYTFKLTYKLLGYTNPLDTTVYSTHYDTLVISYKPDSLAAFQDQNVKRYTGYHRIKVIMTGLYELSSAGGTPVPVDMSANGNFYRFNFNVEGAVTVQPYHKQVRAANNSLVNVYGNGAPNLNSGNDAPVNDYLPVRWNLQGNSLTNNLELTPVNYELEWTYVDNYTVNPETGVVGEKSTAALDYNFKYNGTRVIVDSNYYKIPLVYQKGYLVYRVRMVRPDSVYYRYPVYGNWNLAEAGTVSSLSTTNYYKITAPHNGDSLNWQYTISFAEQGKYKHVMSYYDGMLKNRQSITRFNSQPNKLIATEQVYDYEGRPSISILPTPVTTDAFRYQYNLSLNQNTNAPYKAADFDNNSIYSCPDDPVIPRLADNALANIYYSALNPNKQGFQKFVPDAGGYPLVQTVYSPGFEDRVDKQGGAGDSLQIGYKHYTKNNYVSGDQMDLNRLFGLNVGLSGFYRKTVAKDPNGQYSLNYTDYKGHTVASSLVGIPDTTQLALMRNANVPDTSSFTEDHMSGMPQQLVGMSRIFEKSYFNDVDGNNMVQYLASFTPYATFCPGKYLSLKADFQYSIIDECGNDAQFLPRSGSLGESRVLTSPTPVPYADAPVYPFLKAGAYQIQKTMTFHADDIEKVVDEFIAMNDNCMRTEQDFVKEEVLSKDYPCPPEKRDCDFRRQSMKDELWPNFNHSNTIRKYGYYNDSSGAFVSNNNSIFTFLPYKVVQHSYLDDGGNPVYYDSTYYHHRYQDTCLVHLPDTVIRFGHVYTHLQDLPVDTFIAIFNDDIAEALLPLHPEYCNLQNCANDPFASTLNNMPDATTAEQMGLLHLQDVIQADPLFSQLPPSFASPYDSLARFAFSGMLIDSLAMIKAYCGCDDPVIFEKCRIDFQNEIAGNVINGEHVKEEYFIMMRNLYLASRQRFKQYLDPQFGGINCAQCQPVRMTLIPPAIYPPTNIVTNPTSNPWGGGGTGGGTTGGNIFGINTAALSNLSLNYPDSFGNQLLQLFHSFGSTADSLAMAAQGIYNQGNTLLNNGAINHIIKDLQNCADSASLQPVRTYLLDLCANGLAQMGHFTPNQIRNALAFANIPLTDLCHPYLINYDYLNQSNTFKFSCRTETFYDAATAALNTGQYIAALTNPSVEYNATLSNSNAFEQPIITKLGNTSVKIQSTYDVSNQAYVLHLYTNTMSDANAVRFYFKDNGGSCQYPFQLSAGQSLSLEVLCINEHEPIDSFYKLNVKGAVGLYAFSVNAVKTSVSGSVSCPVIAWNNTVPMNDEGISNISDCIPCTEMYKLHQAFMDTMNLFSIHEVDHPYYEKSLRNFMNYTLKRSYGGNDYLRFMESCALADHQALPLQNAYASLLFTSPTAAQLFLQGIGQIDTTVAFWPKLRYITNVNNQEWIHIDLNTVPQSLWKTYKAYITAYTTDVLVKQVNVPFLDVAQQPSLISYILTASGPLSFGDVAAIQSNTGLEFNYWPHGILSIFNGINYQANNVAYLVLPSGMSSTDAGRKLDWVQNYLTQHNIVYTLLNRYASTVDNQYYTPEKTAYLGRVNGILNLSRRRALDSLEAAPLIAGLPVFNGKVLSYGTYTRPNDVENLYIVDPATVTNGTQFGVLQTILDGVKTYLGGNKLFFSIGNTRQVLPAQKLTAYRCGDESFWFRYFGVNDTLYNVYLKPPSFIKTTELANYTVAGIEVMPGDERSNSFKLVMYNPSAPVQYVTVKAYTDFVIGNNKKLNNVLLANPLTLNEEDSIMNCERMKLEAAVYEGKVRYRHYRDSVRNQMIGDFTDYVMHNGVTEQLTTSYKTQRFNYTLYEYDRAQNLIRTIPPAGVKYLDVNLLSQVNTERENGGNAPQYLPEHKKASLYHYNSLNQVVDQSTPDGGKTEFFYDAAGRMIFSQNEKQRESGRMTYTLYDEQSRIIETGQAKVACAPYFVPLPSTTIPATYTCAYLVNGLLTPFPPQVANLKAYTNSTIVSYVRALAREEVVMTQYDDPALNLAAQAGMSAQDNLRKRVAAIKYFDALAANNQGVSNYDYAMHFSYDIAGNVKTLTRDYPSWSAANQRFKRVDYDYDLISGKVNLLSYNRGFADQYYQRYGYDDDNRITDVETSADGIVWNRDAGYQYYDHGPLARMSLGQQRVQGVDYAYTIQGWLKAINGDVLNPGKDMGEDAIGNSIHGRDAVAMSIDYFKGDYKPIGDTIVTFAATMGKNLYNGNIPRTSTAIKPFENLSATYTYDQLNRLMRAQYAELAGDGTLTPTNRYKNSYSYDADGNLQQLTRNGNNNSLLQMDSLIYRYTVGNTDNRLQNVNDYVANNYTNDIKQNTVNNVSRYLYDRTGNLVKDLVGGQDTIQWNHYNKVNYVVQDDDDSTTLRFAYDGSGQRYLRTNTISDHDTTIEKGEYYVRDAQGNILAVYNAETRYEVSAVTVMTNILNYTIGQAGIANTLGNFIVPTYGNNGGFQQYMLNQATLYPTWLDNQLTAHTPSYYMQHSPVVYAQFLAHPEKQNEIYAAMAEYTTNTSEKVLANAIEHFIIPADPKDYNPGRILDWFNQLFSPASSTDARHKAVSYLTNMGNQAAVEQLYKAVEVYYDGSNMIETIGRMEEAVQSGMVNVDLLSEAFYINFIQNESNRPDLLDFLDNVCKDTDIHSLSNGENGGVLNQLINNTYQAAMVDVAGYQPEFGHFADYWPSTQGLMMMQSSSQELLSVIYSQEPATVVNGIYTESGNSTNMLVNGILNTTGYTVNWQSMLATLQQSMVMQVPTTVYQDALKAQNLYLSSHHLYGSSRLGTKDYLSKQVYSSIDLTGAQAVYDTTLLSSRRPWYSAEYQDIIGGNSTTPWGMADQGHFAVNHNIGQKQYELSNHLGNVQATVSDMPFIKRELIPGTDILAPVKEPALVSAYDYYPFGMLQPGRYVSDTTSQCLTVSRNRWVTTWISYCVPAWSPSYYTELGTATATLLSNNTLLSIQASSVSSGISLVQNVQPGIVNNVSLDIASMSQTGDDATIIQAVEMIGNDAVVLGSIPVTGKGTYRISFKPTGSSVQLWVLGAYDILLKPTCYTYPVTTQETYLVDICDENKDRYRFGFNGMEKDNELKGIGNSLDFGARMYDSRVARWMSIDPSASKYPSLSPYNAFENNPISLVDRNGEDAEYYIKGNQITVKSTIYLVNGTELDRRHIKTEIDKIYRPQSFKAYNGVTYSIKFDVNVVIIKNQQELFALKPWDTRAYISDQSDYRDNVVGGTVMNLSKRSDAVAHEFGHILGFVDLYFDVYTSKLGRSSDRIEDYTLSGIAYDGVPDNHLMNNSNGVFLKSMVVDLGNYIVRNATNTGLLTANGRINAANAKLGDIPKEVKSRSQMRYDPPPVALDENIQYENNNSKVNDGKKANSSGATRQSAISSLSR
jgi:RHS repeat-associated protein